MPEKTPSAKAQVKAPPKPRQTKNEQGVLARAILTGIAIGLFAVLLGVIASIVVYGDVLPMLAAP
jgi:hypothetical protein